MEETTGILIFKPNSFLNPFSLFISGQLGLEAPEYSEFNPTPTKLTSLPPIKSISCGAAFSLAVTHDGDLWAWGYGEMGQLANESSDAPIPFQIDLKGRKVIMASGGGQHSVILVAPKDPLH